MNTPPLGNTPNYSMKIQDKVVTVPANNQDAAAEIDLNQDHFLSKQELETYLSSGRGKTDADQVNEFQCALAQVRNPYTKGYHSFDALIKDFDKLASDNANYVKKEVLGKTAEGRDIVAYKFSEGAQGDTSSKIGFVITGCHHAREWVTAEAPLTLGKSLLAGIAGDPAKQQRLKDAEVWIIPCVNPDGYEYSREHDNMWRKNRSPLGTDASGQPTRAVGVDLNRNYGENTLNHRLIWDPLAKPGSTDLGPTLGATSDDPYAETYRGRSAASEPEVKAMQDLELRPNMRGTEDYHSFGDDFLYPWSHTSAKPPEEAFYQKLGGEMCEATGYKLSPGVGLYPNSGSSDIFQEANGLLTFTVEMGQSFQPNPKQIPTITGKVALGTTMHIDRVIDEVKSGHLGPRVPLEMPPAQISRGGGLEQIRTDSDAGARYFGPR